MPLKPTGFGKAGESRDPEARRPASRRRSVSGRDVPPDVIAMADTVTEMRDVKHPFRAGIKAQEGIDL